MEGHGEAWKHARAMQVFLLNSVRVRDPHHEYMKGMSGMQLRQQFLKNKSQDRQRNA